MLVKFANNLTSGGSPSTITAVQLWFDTQFTPCCFPSKWRFKVKNAVGGSWQMLATAAPEGSTAPGILFYLSVTRTLRNYVTPPLMAWLCLLHTGCCTLSAGLSGLFLESGAGMRSFGVGCTPVSHAREHMFVGNSCFCFLLFSLMISKFI